MVSMNAGQLDGRNIGSNVTLPYLSGDSAEATVSGALALVVQDGDNTEILLAHDEEWVVVPRGTKVEINLPPAAAYTLGVKNATEEILAKLKAE